MMAPCICCAKKEPGVLASPSTVLYQPVYTSAAVTILGLPWWVWALLVILIVRVKS